jgi:hypothetical protein
VLERQPVHSRAQLAALLRDLLAASAGAWAEPLGRDLANP